MSRILMLILASSLLGSVLTFENVNAQSISLSVSARDTGGKFFGPQIVQIVVEGESIRQTDTSPASLVVNGVNVPLVHLTDSRWYAFVADADTFTMLASVAGFPGSSSGNFWIVGPQGKDGLFPSLPNPFGHDATTNDPRNPSIDLDGDCPEVVNANDPCVDWPFIRLMNFNENDQVSIRYSGQSVTLNYVSTSPSDVTMSLDRTSYPPNAEIIFGLSDYMWNINPVEEDRVIFAFGSGGSSEVFYQVSRSMPPASITGIMQNLGFDLRQILALQGRDAIRFENQIGGTPATVLIETFPNAGIFENFDNRADMFGKSTDVQFRFDYFDRSISAGMDTSDASISVGKEEPEPKNGEDEEERSEPAKEQEPPAMEEDEPEAVEPYLISEPQLVDMSGDPVADVQPEQPVMVQTNIRNNLEREQPFVYIVQVKDENDFTEMLTWIKGTMNAGKSFNTAISWTPEDEGTYTVEVFVWKDIDEPGSMPLSKGIEVMVDTE